MGEVQGNREAGRTGPWLVGALVAGVFLRTSGVRGRALFGDELHALADVERGYGEILGSFGTWGSHAAMPLLQKLCLSFLGDGALALRLPALVPGLALLLSFPYLARRFVSGPAVLVATWGVALSPMFVFYGGFARSYSLACLLGWLLLAVLQGPDRDPDRDPGGDPGGERPSKRRWCAAALLGGLLPWVHLSGASLVGGAFLGAALVRRRAGRARWWLAPALAAAGALALTAALFAPAWDEVEAFVRGRQGAGGEPGTTGLLDVTTLLFGGRGAGLAGLFLVPVGLAFLWDERRSSALLVASALASTVLAFALAPPYGMAYAFSRYFLVCLPALWLVLGEALVGLARRAVGASRSSAGEGRATALATALVVAGFLFGPLAPWRAERGVYGASYLALRALPAFDVPFPARSAVYGRIADEEGAVEVVEAPLLANRAVLLYRNHWRTHGRDTRVGLSARPTGGLSGRPYAWLFDPALGRERPAWILLHRDPESEARAYWDFVYGAAWPERERRSDASYMARQSRYAPPAAPPPELERALRERWGEPEHDDELVVAWRVGG